MVKNNLPNFAGFVSHLGATCLFAIFEISHQSRNPLRLVVFTPPSASLLSRYRGRAIFFGIPKLLKNTGQNWATYFFHHY